VRLNARRAQEYSLRYLAGMNPAGLPAAVPCVSPDGHV